MYIYIYIYTYVFIDIIISRLSSPLQVFPSWNLLEPPPGSWNLWIRRLVRNPVGAGQGNIRRLSLVACSLFAGLQFSGTRWVPF